MSGSSIVPSTWLWLARICSSRVEPARGMPRMKIGSGASQPWPSRAAKNSAVITAMLRSTRSVMRSGSWSSLRGADAISCGIVMPGTLRLRGGPPSPCQREVEVELVVGIKRGIVERRLHRRDVGIVEFDRLEVGKAPPDFAKAGREFDRAAIGGDRLVLLADRLEQMGQAHPDFWLLAVTAEHLAVEARWPPDSRRPGPGRRRVGCDSRLPNRLRPTADRAARARRRPDAGDKARSPDWRAPPGTKAPAPARGAAGSRCRQAGRCAPPARPACGSRCNHRDRAAAAPSASGSASCRWLATSACPARISVGSAGRCLDRALLNFGCFVILVLPAQRQAEQAQGGRRIRPRRKRLARQLARPHRIVAPATESLRPADWPWPVLLFPRPWELGGPKMPPRQASLQLDGQPCYGIARNPWGRVQ